MKRGAAQDCELCRVSLRSAAYPVKRIIGPVFLPGGQRKSDGSKQYIKVERFGNQPGQMPFGLDGQMCCALAIWSTKDYGEPYGCKVGTQLRENIPTGMCALADGHQGSEGRVRPRVLRKEAMLDMKHDWSAVMG